MLFYQLSELCLSYKFGVKLGNFCAILSRYDHGYQEVCHLNISRSFLV